MADDPIFCFKPRPIPDIRIGNCLELLKMMPADSIDCCVTSPPYFNLRDYQTATWEGGDPLCGHRVGGQVMDSKAPGAILSGMRPDSRCLDCGAIRNDQQIGLERTPEAYVEKMVEVFQEVNRVLKDTGTLFLNLGDSYSNDDKWGGASGGKHSPALHGATGIGRNRVQTGLKPKDLIGIPWMTAFALRATGWYLRSDIIWQKMNCLPESVRDRCTKSHEYVFMLTKSKNYYFDAVAIAEPTTTTRMRGPALPDLISTHNGGLDTMRNRRSVWSINTKSFRGAHFATMPPDLAKICINAGSSEYGCCSLCGAPWRRRTERVDQGYDGSRYGLRQRLGTLKEGVVSGTASSTLGSSHGQLIGQQITVDWEASCACPENQSVPCTVLDPFGGAGTSGLVAQRLGRRAILIELNPIYAELARNRIAAEQD